MKRNPNRPRRREPYHFDATGAQYIACIETALQHGAEHSTARLADDLSHAAAVYAQLNHRPNPGGANFERVR